MVEKYIYTDKEELKLYEDSVNAYRDIVNAIRTAEKKKFAEGMAEGMAKGKAEGMAEGIAEGMAKGEKAAKVKIAAKPSVSWCAYGNHNASIRLV